MTEETRACKHHGEVPNSEWGRYFDAHNQKDRLYCKLCNRERAAAYQEKATASRKERREIQEFRVCPTHGELPILEFGSWINHDSKGGTRYYYCNLCKKSQRQRRGVLIKEHEQEKIALAKSKPKKTCIHHGELLPADIAVNSLGQTRCKLCQKESKICTRRSKGDAKQKDRQYNLKSSYGISVEEYDSLSASQNDLCMVCKKKETKKMRGVVSRLSVDHCHQAEKNGEMKIRGLLCMKCNTGIAMFNDSPEMLREAANYLEKHIV